MDLISDDKYPQSWIVQPSYKTDDSANGSSSGDIDKRPSLLRRTSSVTKVSVKQALRQQTSKASMARKQSYIVPESGQRIQRSMSFLDNTLEEEAIEEELIGENSLSQTERPPLLKGFVYDFIRSDISRSVLKASLTYFIASLAVFWTSFAGLLGSSDSKHLVCTIVVYFHASRTKGSMIQSIMFVILAIWFAFTVSIILMSACSYFFNKDSPEFGYSISLIFSSISLGFISLVKQLVSKETFNTACSLCAITIISCVIKEGSRDGSVVPWSKIYSIFLIVTTGCIISALSCYFLWPTSAELEFKKTLNKNSNLLSSALKQITDRFLKYENIATSDFISLTKSIDSNLQKMSKYLEESKYELYLDGREKEYELFQRIYNICTRLNMSMGGLRRSAEFQFEILNEADQQNSQEFRDTQTLASYHSDVEEIVENSISTDLDNTEDVIVAMDSKELLDLFVFYLGPSMKSFAFTMRSILNSNPFDDGWEVQKDITQYCRSLVLARELFDDHQSKAMNKLYNQDIFKEDTDFDSKVDQEEVAASCGNFSGMLSEFAKDLTTYLEQLRAYSDVSHGLESYEFLKFWERRPVTQSSLQYRDRSLNEILENIRRNNSNNAGEVSVKRNSIGYKLWTLTKLFRSVDIQFGLRVGLGSLAIAIFAYLDKTKDFFDDWRGEWALVTFCIIMNKSVGGTNMTIKWRFIGTFLGALSAYLLWELFESNVLAMAISGFLVALPCFYIILYWKQNNAFGRFILLTYNLTLLYSYTMSKKMPQDTLPDYDDEGGDQPIIFEIAIHRFIGVSFGVIWAVVVTMTLFPNSARSRIRRGLSLLWLRMGIIWNSGPLAYEYNDETQDYRLVGIRDRKMVHSIMAELTILLKQAPMELRLKGPFPTVLYQQLLNSTSKIIDAFENMNSMIEVDTLLSENEKIVLDQLQEEMNELEHRVFLIFYMLASSIRLEFPIASKPASTAHANERMLVKLSEIRNRIDSNNQMLKNEDFILLYSYNLVTNSITNELDILLNLVTEIYGEVTEDTLDL